MDFEQIDHDMLLLLHLRPSSGILVHYATLPPRGFLASQAVF